MCLVVSTVLVFLNVIARDVFVAPIPWAEELSVLLMVMSVYLVQPALEVSGRQLSITVLSSRWSGPLGRRLHRTATALVSIVIYGALAWAGFGVVAMNRSLGPTTPVLALPLWIIYGALTAVVLLIVLLWIVDLVRPRRGAGRV